MKKAVSYLLLFSYIIILVKPVLPCVSDFLAHAFWKYEHIATVHTENGKSHLHYELQQAAKENGAEKNKPASKAETEVSPHIITNTSYEFSIAQLRNIYFSSNISSPAFVTIIGNYPPPKA